MIMDWLLSSRLLSGTSMARLVGTRPWGQSSRWTVEEMVTRPGEATVAGYPASQATAKETTATTYLASNNIVNNIFRKRCNNDHNKVSDKITERTKDCHQGRKG